MIFITPPPPVRAKSLQVSLFRCGGVDVVYPGIIEALPIQTTGCGGDTSYSHWMSADTTVH